MLFAVEMLLPEVSNRTFLPVVVATATATYVGRIAFGLDPAFIVPISAEEAIEAIAPIQLGAYALLGVLAGIASWAFIRTLAWCEDLFPKLPGNDYTQNIIGMLIIGTLSYVLMLTTGHYHTAGVGYATIQDILNSTPYTFILLAVLFIAKIIATSISLGAGHPAVSSRRRCLSVRRLAEWSVFCVPIYSRTADLRRWNSPLLAWERSWAVQPAHR